MKAHGLTKSACGCTEVRVFSVYPFGLPACTGNIYFLSPSSKHFILYPSIRQHNSKDQGDRDQRYGQKADSLKLRAAEKQHICVLVSIYSQNDLE